MEVYTFFLHCFLLGGVSLMLFLSRKNPFHHFLTLVGNSAFASYIDDLAAAAAFGRPRRALFRAIAGCSGRRRHAAQIPTGGAQRNAARATRRRARDDALDVDAPAISVRCAYTHVSLFPF